MKKKLILFLSVVLVIAIITSIFVGCDKPIDEDTQLDNEETESIPGGGDSGSGEPGGVDVPVKDIYIYAEGELYYQLTDWNHYDFNLVKDIKHHKKSDYYSDEALTKVFTDEDIQKFLKDKTTKELKLYFKWIALEEMRWKFTNIETQPTFEKEGRAFVNSLIYPMDLYISLPKLGDSAYFYELKETQENEYPDYTITRKLICHYYYEDADLTFEVALPNDIKPIVEYEYGLIPTYDETGYLDRYITLGTKRIYAPIILPATKDYDYKVDVIREGTCLVPEMKAYTYNLNGKDYVVKGTTEVGKHKYENGRCIHCGKYEGIKASDGLVYALDDSETSYSVVGVEENATEIIVPKAYQNKPVTSIKQDAFINASTVEKIYIGDNIKSVEEGTFSGLTNLKDVTMPDNLYEQINKATVKKLYIIEAHIGYKYNRYVQEWPNLKELYIDKDIDLATNGIRNCPNLKMIDANCNLETQDFSMCPLLEEIRIFPDSYGKLTSQTVKKVIFKEISDELLYDNIYQDVSLGDLSNIESITIPGTFKHVSNLNISKSIKEIIFSEGVESIDGDYSLLVNLEKIVLPSTIKYIGIYKYNSSLKRVEITSLKDWLEISFSGGNANPLAAGASLYINNSKVEDVVIPNDVTMLNSYAFFGYKDLKSITIPKTVVKIHGGIITNCDNLSKINIEDNPYYEVDGLSILEKYTKALVSTSEKKISSKAYKIAENAFAYATGITKMPILDQIYEIESYAFAHSDIGDIVLPRHLKYIREQAFAFCNNITKVTHNECRIVDIEELAFYHTTNLLELILPQVVEHYDVDLLTNSGIKKLTLPYLGDDKETGLFADKDATIFSDVTDLTILSGIILESTSAKFTALTSLTIGKDVNIIEGGVFWASEDLREVHIDYQNERYLFNDCFIIDKVSKELIAAFGTSYIPSDISLVKAHAFKNRKYITRIVCQSDNTKFDFNVFEGCTELEWIHINLDGHCLYRYFSPYTDEVKKCTKLSSITVIGGVISEDAFYGLDNRIGDIYIKKGVEEIEPYAFSSVRGAIIRVEDKAPKETWDVNFDKVKILNDRIPYQPANVMYDSENDNREGLLTFEHIGGVVCGVLDGEGFVALQTSNVGELYGVLSINSDVDYYPGEPIRITKVAPYAFYGNNNITAISLIGPYMLEVGEGAFEYCQNLQDVILDDSIIKINAKAFYETNISQLRIPSGLEHIGENAFDVGYKKQIDKIIFESRTKELFGKDIFGKSNLDFIEIPDMTIFNLLHIFEGERHYSVEYCKMFNNYCWTIKKGETIAIPENWSSRHMDFGIIIEEGGTLSYSGFIGANYEVYLGAGDIEVCDDIATAIYKNAKEVKMFSDMSAVVICNDGTQIFAYLADANRMDVNASIGPKITGIGPCAFSHTKNLLAENSVQEGITKVYNFAFENRKIKILHILGDNTTIGYNTFGYSKEHETTVFYHGLSTGSAAGAYIVSNAQGGVSYNGVMYAISGDVAYIQSDLRNNNRPKDVKNILSKVTYKGKEYPVVRIGGCAFNDERIETIDIPAFIKEITSPISNTDTLKEIYIHKGTLIKECYLLSNNRPDVTIYVEYSEAETASFPTGWNCGAKVIYNYSPTV